MDANIIADKQFTAVHSDEQAALQDVVMMDSGSIQAECDLIEGGAVLVSLFDNTPFTAYTLDANHHVLDIRLCIPAFTKGYKASVVVWAEEHVFVHSNENNGGGVMAEEKIIHVNTNDEDSLDGAIAMMMEIEDAIKHHTWDLCLQCKTSVERGRVLCPPCEQALRDAMDSYRNEAK